MYYKGREYFGAVVTGRSLRGGRMRALGPLETSALLPGVEGGFVLFLVVSSFSWWSRGPVVPPTRLAGCCVMRESGQ